VRRLIFVSAVVVAALFASTAGAVTAPPTSYTDATGDAGSAPDISMLSATNDDHGLYTLTISFATPYTGSDDVLIFMDSDNNSATGDPDAAGSDYLLVDDYGSHTFDLASWVNNDWADAPDSTMGVVVASDNKSVTFTINKSDLGNSAEFNFFVLTTDGSESTDSGHFDEAPDGTGLFAYTLQTVFSLSTGTYHDGAAKAGGTWTVSSTAVRSDTGQPLTSGANVTCVGKEGSKKLAVASSGFGKSGATCTFRLPKKPKHATVHATVTISDNGQSTTKTFSATTH
jgi:hypothetical protein